MKQRKDERESNLKIWRLTATAIFIILGVFLVIRIPKNDELNDLKAEIQNTNKQIDQEKNNQINNSVYKQKIDVVSEAEKARDKFLEVIPAIYTKRSVANQEKEFNKWEKILPGVAGKRFIKDYGDSYGFVKNNNTMVYFGKLTNVKHTKITVVSVAVNKNKKEMTYEWNFDYDLKAQKINSFKEVQVERN